MIQRLMAAMHAFTAPAKPAAEETKVNPVGPLTIPFFSSQEVAPPEGYEQLSADGYHLCAVANTCIRRIAKATAALPIKLQRHGADGRWQDLDATEDDEHPLMQLLRRPNPKMTKEEMLEAVFTSRMIAGESFLLPFTGTSAQPLELWWTMPNRWHCVPGEDGLVQSWIYKTGKGERPFPMDVQEGTVKPVLFWKTHNPTDEWRGLGELGSAKLQLMQTNGASRWNANLIKNNMRPPGVLSYEPSDGMGKTLGRSQRQSVENEIRTKLSGPGGAGSSLVLDGGWKWQEMSVSPKDLDWLSGQQYADRTICFVLGYPPIMLGIPGDSTYKNYSEARTSFYQDTCIPLLKSLLSYLNEELVPAFGDDIRLVVDEDNIDALTEKRNEMWDRVEKSTILTINEKRERVGLDPIESPLADQVWVPTSLTPLDEALTDPEAEIDPETGKPKDPKEVDPEDDAAEDSKVPAKKARDEGYTSSLIKLQRLARRMGSIFTRKEG